MEKESNITWTVNTAYGIRPIEDGINHIKNNIKTQEGLDFAKDYAQRTKFTCCDYNEFTKELLKIEL